MSQTFKYSPLLVLAVLGLDRHGLILFISRLSEQAVVVVVVQAMLELVSVEVLEVVEAHLQEEFITHLHCLAL
jgi:hypothetical protein